MSFTKYYQRISQIDQLIRRKSTGTSDELAGKLHLSRSATMDYLKEMKKLGFPIAYSKKHHRFYYKEEGKMISSLFEKTLPSEELKKLKGGMMSWQDFFTVQK